jgi:hypothetical protein
MPIEIVQKIAKNAKLEGLYVIETTPITLTPVVSLANTSKKFASLLNNEKKLELFKRALILSGSARTFNLKKFLKILKNPDDPTIPCIAKLETPASKTEGLIAASERISRLPTTNEQAQAIKEIKAFAEANLPDEQLAHVLQALSGSGRRLDEDAAPLKIDEKIKLREDAREKIKGKPSEAKLLEKQADSLYGTINSFNGHSQKRAKEREEILTRLNEGNFSGEQKAWVFHALSKQVPNVDEKMALCQQARAEMKDKKGEAEFLEEQAESLLFLHPHSEKQTEEIIAAIWARLNEGTFSGEQKAGVLHALSIKAPDMDQKIILRQQARKEIKGKEGEAKLLWKQASSLRIDQFGLFSEEEKTQEFNAILARLNEGNFSDEQKARVLGPLSPHAPTIDQQIELRQQERKKMKGTPSEISWLGDQARELGRHAFHEHPDKQAKEFKPILDQLREGHFPDEQQAEVLHLLSPYAATIGGRIELRQQVREKIKGKKGEAQMLIGQSDDLYFLKNQGQKIQQKEVDAIRDQARRLTKDENNRVLDQLGFAISRAGL